jgi:hypothetical protein
MQDQLQTALARSAALDFAIYGDLESIAPFGSGLINRTFVSVKDKALSFKALPADADWFGVTYKEDKASMTARVAELVARGVYPASLWT